MHHFHHCIGRHRSHGFGHFGTAFTVGGMGGGMGGRGLGMGRKLASGALQLLILKLLEERPRYGYEIIKELEQRSGGFYVPSPGMVYPALTYLEEIGHATLAADGARKLYSITAAGKEYLEENISAADALFAQFSRVGEKMERVRRALDADEEVADPADQERRGSRELQRARRELKMALANKWHSPREEQQRIAAILAKAVAEIAGN